MGKYETSGPGRYGSGEDPADAQDCSNRQRQEDGDEPPKDTGLNWYIIALDNECCDVMSIHEGEQPPDHNGKDRKVWGPFRSQEGAIARRIGLIRAGKCKPY